MEKLLNKIYRWTLIFAVIVGLLVIYRDFFRQLNNKLFSLNDYAGAAIELGCTLTLITWILMLILKKNTNFWVDEQGSELNLFFYTIKHILFKSIKSSLFNILKFILGLVIFCYIISYLIVSVEVYTKQASDIFIGKLFKIKSYLICLSLYFAWIFLLTTYHYDRYLKSKK